MVRRILLGFTVLLATAITACQVHYYQARKTPAVRGIVRDMQTGKPIKDAYVCATVFGFPADPVAAIASPPKWALAGTTVTTGDDGRFALEARRPSPKDTGVSWWSYVLWGPDEKTAIGVFVWTPEYQTVLSEAKGFSWTRDPILDKWYDPHDPPIRVRRSGDLKRGFDYAVDVKRAVTEKDWEDKCRMTLNNTNPSHEPGASWLFSDLTAYLEKWPEGQKVGEFYIALWETAPLGPCDYIREELAAGNLTRARLEKLCERARKIISLAEGFCNPPGRMTAESFEEGLNEHRRDVSCARDYLGGKQSSERERTP
jgi:hypothetical protein